MTDYSSSTFVSPYDETAVAEVEEETTTPEPAATKKSSTRRSSGGSKRKSAKTSESAIRDAIKTYDKMKSATDSELAIMAALLGVEATAVDVAVAKSTKPTPASEVGAIVAISEASDGIEAMVEATVLVEDKAALRRAWTILDAASGSEEDLPVSRTHTISLAASLVRRVRSLDTATLADLTSAAADLA